jgi:hypothetical protein
LTTAAGLVLALLSTFALNWGWLAQHGAASELPPLAIRRPLHSLRLLFADRTWLIGFLAGVGGWVLYVVALALAPLSLVQATSAGGIGLLAGLAHRRGDLIDRTDWAGVGIAATGLTLLAVSLVGGTTAATHPDPAALIVWLGCSLGVASVLFFGRAGLAAGTLYAAGDVATKGALFGGVWLVLVPVLLLAHGLAFVALTLGFQRADALATAGTASVLTNALPIAAGVVLFHEHLPGGAAGLLRVAGFVLVIIAAGLLARRRALIPVVA